MSERPNDDPVERTKKQLRCYYQCVARGEPLCDECTHYEKVRQAAIEALDFLTHHDRDDFLWFPEF